MINLPSTLSVVLCVAWICLVNSKYLYFLLLKFIKAFPSFPSVVLPSSMKGPLCFDDTHMHTYKVNVQVFTKRALAFVSASD